MACNKTYMNLTLFRLTAQNMSLEDMEIDLSSTLSNYTNVSESGETTGEGEKIQWPRYTIIHIVTFCILIVGSFGNAVVLYMFCKFKQLQTPFNMFLVNLSIVALITAAFGSVPPLTSSIMQGGNMGCTVYGFWMALAAITSAYTLAWLALDRILTTKGWCCAGNTKQRSFLIISIIWTCSSFLSVLLVDGVAFYSPEGPYISCSASWRSKDYLTKIYVYCYYAFGLLIPLAIMLTCYGFAWWTFKTRPRFRHVGSEAVNNPLEKEVTKLLGAMITCFLISWLPYAVVEWKKIHDRESVTAIESVVTDFLVKLSTCYNPILYVKLSSQFRHSWKDAFKVCQRNGESSRRNAEITEPDQSGAVISSSQQSYSSRLRTTSLISIDFLTKYLSNNREAKATTSQVFEFVSCGPKIKTTENCMDSLTETMV